MSGSNSSAPPAAPPELASAVGLTVHSMPAPRVDEANRRTVRGRLTMLLVLLVCAAPVAASYFAYFVVRPEAKTNYSTLITPPRAMPADLPLVDLQGRRIAAAALQRQWLLVVVSGGQCDSVCERHLWIQRQLRESLGRDSDRVDKLWLVDDAVAPRAETLHAVESGGAAASVLRVERAALGAWLRPADGQRIEDHMYIVDPRGDWMMRAPPDADPARLKRDVERLLRASAGWDEPGR